jgi:hypothetical protein
VRRRKGAPGGKREGKTHNHGTGRPSHLELGIESVFCQDEPKGAASEPNVLPMARPG